jgi:hypothetical protein
MAARRAGMAGAVSPKRARSCCSRKQKARSLSVLPTGRNGPSRVGPEILQVAVVGEHPVAAPQLAHEGMAVFQRDLALRGLADVGDDVQGLDRVLLDQFGDRLAMAAWWSTKWRTPAPSKKAMPQPSWWVSVRPPRWANPVKLKTMSVGTLQFMASN